MAVRWHPSVAITASRTLRDELHVIEQDAGWNFEHTASIPDGRRYASRRPIIIVGADLVGSVRKPLSCGGFVVVATATSASPRTFAHAGRIGASYVIVLPGAREWLAHQLLHDVSDLIRHGRPTPVTPAASLQHLPAGGPMPSQDAGT